VGYRQQQSMSFWEKLAGARRGRDSDLDWIDIKLLPTKLKTAEPFGSGGGEFQFSINEFRRYRGRAATWHSVESNTYNNWARGEPS